ncbi:FkbM family methyltransferase [Peptococcaceae bacterium]|nr:FkbM family methyltransferase [Peptococcaceae bacterium]
MKDLKTAIYGAGSIGKKLLKVFNKKNIKVDFFIDQYTDKADLGGIPVYRLKDAPRDAVVYITVVDSVSYNIPKSVMEIIDDRYWFSSNVLSECGFFKVIDFADTLKQFPEVIKEFLEDEKLWWCEEKSKMLNYQELEKMRELLRDKESKDILNKLVKFRESLSYEFYPFPTKEVQYFPKEIIPRSWKEINFVDVGAFTGDTLPWLFYFYENKVKLVVCFEPAKENAIKLSTTIERLKKLYPKTEFITVPAAVWDSEGFIGFDFKAASSKVCEDSKNIVPLVTLDKVLSGYFPTYIKMDIEGAELEAIKGAEKLIKTAKPYLAISIYHKPEDLWQIPLFVSERFSFYDLYIRVHGNFGLETILYCVPKRDF